MTHTARTYTPRAGSLPARVIQFFTVNRQDTLTSADEARVWRVA